MAGEQQQQGSVSTAGRTELNSQTPGELKGGSRYALHSKKKQLFCSCNIILQEEPATINGSADHKECTCLIAAVAPNVTQKDKENPEKTLTCTNSTCNTHIESLLVNTRGPVEGQAMLQTSSFTLNTQHTVFSVPHPKVAHAQLYLHCVLPALRAAKQCTKTEMKNLCKYMLQNLRELSQWFPDMSYGGNYFTCCFEHQRNLSRQAFQWKALQTSEEKPGTQSPQPDKSQSMKEKYSQDSGCHKSI